MSNEQINNLIVETTEELNRAKGNDDEEMVKKFEERLKMLDFLKSRRLTIHS
jgi:hypothetical protein